MRRIILSDPTFIHPFNEPARDLRVHNKPLWLWQRDILSAYVNEEREYPTWQIAQKVEGSEMVEAFVHRDNLFFNEALIEEFLTRARSGRKPVRLAFHKSDPAISEHVIPLTRGLFCQDELVLADIWYLPQGVSQSVVATPLIVDSEAKERGYYFVPPYMSSQLGDLVYQLPRKAFVAIESWVHVFIVDILFGVFARGVNKEAHIDQDWIYKLKILAKSLLEQKQTLSSSELVKVGKNVTIDPSAIIHGPTTIGDNVRIEAGVVIDNCIIGSNVTIAQGCQLMLSVVGDGCFLPFRAALFMTTLMENTSIAQNSCLQLCVIGRDSFVGAGTTFTDYNVLPGTIRAETKGGLEDTNLKILGSCVGHHCRLTSGLILYPARTVESDVVLISSDQRRFIHKSVAYEQSDHHQYPHKDHPRLYPRQGE